MPKVYFKTGKTIEVDIDELEKYLYEREKELETKHVKRRGSKRR